MDRWSLPGPDRYLRGAVEALQQGHNLILGTPATGCPGDLATILRDRLLADSWNVAGPVDAGAADPVEALFDGLGLESDPAGGRRTTSLLYECMASGQVVLVRGVSAATWPAWRRMLTEFEALSRNVSAFDRSLLMVVTEGVPLAALQVSAAALRGLPWKGVVGEIDMLLYVSARLHEKSAATARSNLVARAIAKLALWDFELADALLERTPAELFKPAALMAAVAASADQGRERAGTWESGGLQRFDGMELRHPFVHAAAGDPEGNLAMRVWAAQAAEIFPAIELQRRALAKRIRTMVQMPVMLGNMSVADLDDLEIGQLNDLARQHRLPASICQATEKWRWIRNRLAHLQVLEAHKALDPELLG